MYTLFVWSKELGLLADEEMRITDEERRKIAKYIFLSREKNLLRDSQTKIASELV